MTALDELRELVWQQNVRLPAEGLVSLTWGNVSARSEDGELVVIKPSGVPYAEMLPTDMVVLSLDGQVVEGTLRPSTDTPTHLELYRSFESIGGIVHVHSTYATSFAQARTPLTCLGTTHADHFSGAVPVTRSLTAEEVASAYELETGRVIVRHFETFDIDETHTPAVLVAGHGPFVWAADPVAAVDNAVALEASAHMALNTKLIAPEVPELESWIRAIHHERKHGTNAYYGQE